MRASGLGLGLGLRLGLGFGLSLALGRGLYDTRHAPHTITPQQTTCAATDACTPATDTTRATPTQREWPARRAPTHALRPLNRVRFEHSYLDSEGSFPIQIFTGLRVHIRSYSHQFLTFYLR